MICRDQLKSVAVAFLVFTVLPVTFWSSLTYLVIDGTVAKIVGITFLIAGLYTCYRGSHNNYTWFSKCKKPRLKTQ